MTIVKLSLTVIVFFIVANTNAQSLSTEFFSRLPAFQRANLSPSGEKLAYIENTMIAGGTAFLSVYNFAEGKSQTLLQSDNVKVKINWFEWANDDILLISARYETRTRGQRFYQTRLHKVALSSGGGELKPVMRKRSLGLNNKSVHLSQFQDNVIDFLPDDPDHILMQVDFDKHAMPSVYKVNVNTARISRIEKAKRDIRHWTTDQQNVVRIGFSRDYDDPIVKYYHRFTEEDDFEVLFQYDLIKDKPITVMGFGLDPKILYYKAYDGDYQVVYKMDLTNNVSEIVLANDGYDVDGKLIYSSITKDVIGVSNSHSEFGKHYFEKKHYALARILKKTFGGKDTRITTQSKDETRYVVLVESDNSPPVYFYGNRKTQQIVPIFSQYPELDSADLAQHKKITYKTRDDIEIEAYLTLPTFGEAPYPTIIHPHGGPGTRDYSGFDPWIAYMTSRGYAVMRPNFRGSSGYGYEFAQAQMGRWGLEMQDDITDAAQWLFNEKIADQSKICIFGASYGGYAAKMATVKTPELFTCAVSFAGVGDLDRLARDQGRYLGGELVADNQLGDNKKDLRARSPITHVKKIQTPLLVMHGDQDFVVRVEQSRDFIDELEDEDKVFKYVEFEDGDHYLSIQRNRKLFFEELDAFFIAHLGEVKMSRLENIPQ